MTRLRWIFLVSSFVRTVRSGAAKCLAPTFCVLALVGFTKAGLGFGDTLHSDIQISTSLKDGDRIAGVVELRVTVVAPDPVNQVEFYVSDQLRGTDASTPYTLRIDTILEKEGLLQIEIAAFIASGESKKIILNLVIDNGLDKGAKHHTDNAVRFMQVSKWDEAIQAARVALKADEGYVPAKLAMAQAYYGKGVLDEAQKWAEDVLAAGDSVDAYELLGGIFVQRAFRLMAVSEDKTSALKEIGRALRSAVSMRHKSLEIQIKALGPVTDQNRLGVVDLLLRNNEFAAAARHLMPKWNEFEPDTAIANRLLFALIRQGKMTEAYKIAQAVEKRGAPDDTTWSLIAVGHAYYKNYEKATEALRNATLAGGDSPLMMTAAAYIAVCKDDKAAMASQVQSMLRKSLTDAAVFLYLSVLQEYLGQYLDARDNFERAVTKDPLLYDAYIQRGYVSLATAMQGKDREFMLPQAAEFMEVAREAKPDSAEALNGLAIVYLNQNKKEDALRMAEAAVRAGPEYPWAWFTYSCALERNGKSVDAQNAVVQAGKLDTFILRGRAIPTIEEAWKYTIEHGRIPTLIVPR